MALTLRDVVENRAAQRVSGVRREAAEMRGAVESRRERFFLEAADQRAALDSKARASATARTDTAKTNAPRTDAARADAAKSGAGRPDPAPSTSAKPDAAELDSGRTVETRADRSRPQDETVRDEPARDGPASAKASDTDRAARAEAPAKPVPAKSAISNRPPAPKAGTLPAEQADPPAPEGGTSEPQAAAAESQGEKAIVKEADTTAAAAPTPMMAIFAAPPPPIVPTPSQAAAADATEPEGESDIAATESATGGTAVLAGGNAPARGSATAKPGFDAALAEIASQGSADHAAAAPISQAAEPATAPGGTATLPAPTEAKAAAAVQQPVAAAPVSAPVPLGAVPMTIGLRALGASNRFEIRLDPKELGRIDVSIDIDKDSGTVGARLVVDRQETLALLQRDASSLQQALAQTGLDASAGISLSLRSDGESQRHGTNAEADGQSSRGGRTDRSGREAGIDQIPIDLVPLRALRGIGRVDIRI